MTTRSNYSSPPFYPPSGSRRVALESDVKDIFFRVHGLAVNSRFRPDHIAERIKNQDRHP
jgi:hypothetical protein